MTTDNTVILMKALEKGASSKATLEPGRYDVNSVVRINGQVVVGKPTEVKPTVSIISLDFMLIAMHMAGVTREHAISAIKQTADEYLKGWKGSDEDKEKAKALREEKVAQYDPDGKTRALLDAMISSLPKVPRAGSTKFEGHIEEIQVGSVSADEDEMVANISNVG